MPEYRDHQCQRGDGLGDDGQASAARGDSRPQRHDNPHHAGDAEGYVDGIGLPRLAVRAVVGAGTHSAPSFRV
ncbi:Uncharacterised protein [Mycobacteroides abscessus subsp. abscessus]|nr:Uncharacterised protein [Mycobacteroides abscessus subsp. abscessus]